MWHLLCQAEHNPENVRTGSASLRAVSSVPHTQLVHRKHLSTSRICRLWLYNFSFPWVPWRQGPFTHCFPAPEFTKQTYPLIASSAGCHTMPHYFRYDFMYGLSENRDTQQSSSRRHHAPETVICGYLWKVGCGLPVCNIVRLSHHVFFQINPWWDVVQWQSLTWVRLWVQSSGQ